MVTKYTSRYLFNTIGNSTHSTRTTLIIPVFMLFMFLFPVQSFAQLTTFQKLYSMGLQNILWGLTPASDSGYALIGFQNSFPPIKTQLVKVSKNGVVQWSKEYGKTGIFDFSISLPQHIIQSNDGGYLIAGSLDSKCYLLKTDGSGTTQWAKTYGGSNSSGASFVKQTSIVPS